MLQHSDRGSQYASDAYRELLRRHGAQTSMSRPANCYDNAKMESFWATMKTELIGEQVYASHAEAKAALFDYMRSSTTGGGSTAPSASNPLWTTKTS